MSYEHEPVELLDDAGGTARPKAAAANREVGKRPELV